MRSHLFCCLKRTYHDICVTLKSLMKIITWISDHLRIRNVCLWTLDVELTL